MKKIIIVSLVSLVILSILLAWDMNFKRFMRFIWEGAGCKKMMLQLDIERGKVHRRCQVDADCAAYTCSSCVNRESISKVLGEIHLKAMEKGCLPMFECAQQVECKCKDNACIAGFRK